MTNNLHQLQLEVIVQRCGEETAKWRHRLVQDTRYCFELFRRGLGDGTADALLQIYTLYVPMLARRVERHAARRFLKEDPEHLARIALANFCKSCMQKGFSNRFVEFKSMMSYLFACLHSVIRMQQRIAGREIPLDDDNLALQAPPDLPSDEDERSTETWRTLCRTLQDPQDQQLAYIRFVLGIKPKEIVSRYPQIWKSERAVSVALQRIRRKLLRARDQGEF